MILVASHLLAYELISVIVLRILDLRPEAMLQHAAVPLLQAAIVASLAGTLAPRSMLQAARVSLQLPAIAVLWAVDSIVLAVFWSPWAEVCSAQFVVVFAAVKLMVAAVLLVTGMSTGGARQLSRVLPFALMLVILASNGMHMWLSAVPTWLPSGWPLLLRQAVLLCALLLVLLWLTARAESALSIDHGRAALFVGGLAPCAIVAFLGIVLNGSLYSYLVEPWIHLISTALCVGATSVLTGAVLLKTDTAEQRDAPTPTTSPRKREVGIFELWLILVLTAVATMACLQALVTGQWLWSRDAWLLLVLPPIVQAGCLRGVAALRSRVKIS